MNEESLKQYVKMKGSELTSNFPTIVTEMYFEAGTSIEKIMKAIHHPQVREQWDKDIIHTEVMKVADKKIVLWH